MIAFRLLETRKSSDTHPSGSIHGEEIDNFDKYNKRYVQSMGGLPVPRPRGPNESSMANFNRDDSSTVLALKEENNQLLRLNKELTSKVVKYKQQTAAIPDLKAELA